MQVAEKVEEIVGSEEVLQLQFAGEESNLAADLFGLADDAATVHPGVALVGLDEGGKHAEGGGLAGTIGTEQTENLASVGGEGQVVYRHLAALVCALQTLLLARQGEGLA